MSYPVRARLQYLAATLLALAAAALLFQPAHAQSGEPATPTRFTVVAQGNPTGPAVLLLPGLTSGREVFDAEAAILAPQYRLFRVQLNGFAGQPAGPNASGPILAPVIEELHRYIAANHLHPRGDRAFARRLARSHARSGSP